MSTFLPHDTTPMNRADHPLPSPAPVRRIGRKKKALMDIGPANPVLRLRCALKPASEEMAKRGPRDRAKPHLLQRELAERLGCSTVTIRVLERDKRWPVHHDTYNRFKEMYEQYFPHEPKRKVGFMASKSGQEIVSQALKKKRAPRPKKETATID